MQEAGPDAAGEVGGHADPDRGVPGVEQDGGGDGRQGGAAGAQDRGRGELGGPREGGRRHHDGREDAHARGAREHAEGDAETEHGDGERRDGAHAVAVVSLAGGLAHGGAHATSRRICDPWGPCRRYRPSRYLGPHVGGRRYPLLVPASRITTTAHGLTPERVRHALNGLPPADGYALHVKPLRYRERPHLSAWTDFDDRSITLQVPEPFFPFGEVVPYAAKRRPTARKGGPPKFIWLTEGVTFRTPREVLRFLYCHEWMHVYGTVREGKRRVGETACDRFALQNYRRRRSRSRTRKPRCSSGSLRRASARATAEMPADARDGLRCLRLLTWTRRRRGDRVIDFIEDNHDLIMGAALMIAGVLTVLAIRKPSKRVKTFALVGAAVTFVIGALLFLGLA